jgi:hypothetical protein
MCHLHAIQVFIGLLSIPFLFDCVVSNIAKKMGCPDEKTTKHSKLQWIFVAYLHANA